MSLFQGRKALFIKEEVALLKLTDTYNLLDPDTGAQLGQAKDEPSMKWLRLLVKKVLLPTDVRVYGPGQMAPQLTVHKHVGFLRTRLTVHGASGELLAQLRSKVFSLGGAFEVNDAQGLPMGELKGDWKGWDFAFTVNGQVFGRITKKWAGLAKELFTNADQYLVVLEGPGEAHPQGLALLTGLALAVDVVFKERQG
jgi:uncharacterized protein YxjI